MASISDHYKIFNLSCCQFSLTYCCNAHIQILYIAMSIINLTTCSTVRLQYILEDRQARLNFLFVEVQKSATALKGQ